MNDELTKARNSLTESAIRTFWKSLTQSFPNVCINDGINVNYDGTNEEMEKSIERMSKELSRCKYQNVATPLFQYNYEPDNSTPHHVSAVTLTKLPNYCVLSLFDPKGKGSKRKKEEKDMMKAISKKITTLLGLPVRIKIYNGVNLQAKDYIGLCQLFSLYYLYQYILLNDCISSSSSSASSSSASSSSSSSSRCSLLRGKCHNTFECLESLSNPNSIVEVIETVDGGMKPHVVYKFWKTFWS